MDAKTLIVSGDRRHQYADSEHAHGRAFSGMKGEGSSSTKFSKVLEYGQKERGVLTVVTCDPHEAVHCKVPGAELPESRRASVG